MSDYLYTHSTSLATPSRIPQKRA
eukprot:COSAG05_NODE_21959_length_268_cov_0.609467_1_plen_23_part_10